MKHREIGPRRRWLDSGIRVVLRSLSPLLFTGMILPGAAHGIVVQYPTLLNGNQEVPAVNSPGFGGGRIVIDTDANTLSYEVTFGSLSAPEAAAHIHGPANPGANAGVAVALPLGNPKIGVWNYPQALEADILAGRMYVNIHTAAFPGGEIRGQITSNAAFLDGAQEVPPVATIGQGAGVFQVDTQTNELRYYVVYNGLSSAETAAHLHGFALHGTNAGVRYPLPLGSPKVGIINYAESDEEAILTGRLYVNIHTVNNPGGEIRGQIVPQVVPLNGAQEVPANGSTAAGVGLVSYDPQTDALSYDVRVAGLSAAETAAHIHGFAARGANAGVQVGIPLGARKFGVWNFGAANQNAVLGGFSYFNIHSAAFPGGEIRGQIDGFESLVITDVPQMPSAFFLGQNAPNPFNPATTIRFRLPVPGEAELIVYNLGGQRIRTLVSGRQDSGDHEAIWRGDDDSGQLVPSGVYVARLRAGQYTESQKLTLVK